MKSYAGKFKLWIKSFLQFGIEEVLWIGFRIKRPFVSKKRIFISGLIVSITSYPARFLYLKYTLRNLIRQNFLPEFFTLWIASDYLSQVPKSISKLKKFGVKIYTVETDLGPFTKLIPAATNFPNYYIITFDDDIKYDATCIEALSTEMSNASDLRQVVGLRGFRVQFNVHGEILFYADWAPLLPTSENRDVFLTGVGGILYPPNFFKAEDLVNKDFLNLCPYSDDLWFYYIAKRNSWSRKSLQLKDGVVQPWYGSEKTGLWHTFNAFGGNDAALERLISYDPLFSEKE